MQRWEYLTVKVESVSWTDSAGRKGELVESGDAAPLLNELGEQSWDLAGVTFSGGDYRHESYFRLFLKRPRS